MINYLICWFIIQPRPQPKLSWFNPNPRFPSRFEPHPYWVNEVTSASDCRTAAHRLRQYLRIQCLHLQCLSQLGIPIPIEKMHNYSVRIYILCEYLDYRYGYMNLSVRNSESSNQSAQYKYQSTLRVSMCWECIHIVQMRSQTNWSAASSWSARWE